MRTNDNKFKCSKCEGTYMLEDITFETTQSGDYIADICPKCGHRED